LAVSRVIPRLGADYVALSKILNKASLFGKGKTQLVDLSQVDNETATVLISSVSRALIRYKAQKKRSKNRDLCKKAVSACKQVLALLKAAFPAEYVKTSAVQNEELDIMFVEGVEDGKGPSPEQGGRRARFVKIFSYCFKSRSVGFLYTK
jgi:hypothetical protein